MDLYPPKTHMQNVYMCIYTNTHTNWTQSVTDAKPVLCAYFNGTPFQGQGVLARAQPPTHPSHFVSSPSCRQQTKGVRNLAAMDTHPAFPVGGSSRWSNTGWSKRYMVS